jgi:hypothetical protein
MSLWLNAGKLLVNGSGNLIDCADCPCGVPRVECLCNGTDGMPDGPLNATVTFCGTTTVLSMPQGARAGIGSLSPPIPPYDDGYTVNANCVWSCIGANAVGVNGFDLLQLCGTEGVVESSNLNWLYLACFSYYNPSPTLSYQWRFVWSGHAFTNNAATGGVDNESAYGDDNIVLGIFPGSFVIDTTLPFQATLTVDLDDLVALDATYEGFLDGCDPCSDHTMTIVFTEP